MALCATAQVNAHHSQAAFDATRVITFEGVVHRLDWKNPHIYLIVETRDSEGKTMLQQIEGLAITQALVDGLDRNALTPGTPVLVRANPNRHGQGKTVRGLDVTTKDGKVHPFYQGNTVTPDLVPADSLAGHWAPPLSESSKVFRVTYGDWKYTEAGSARNLVGACDIEPIPFLAAINEVRAIELHENTVVFLHDNSGDKATRTVYLDQASHPADLAPSLMGHSIGHWEGDTLVVDTIGYTAHSSGTFSSVPGGVRKHTVERLSLTDDRLHLKYEVMIEDPDFLAEPGSFTMLWDHRPDLEFSSDPCDAEVSSRYLDD
ncbi:MAG: hypothetical protein H6978_07185 [Gammaproteobacteria bacterium]|nr:hypothetical protein [Gammaproteobacteria bacterium]